MAIPSEAQIELMINDDDDLKVSWVDNVVFLVTKNVSSCNDARNLLDKIGAL